MLCVSKVEFVYTFPRRQLCLFAALTHYLHSDEDWGFWHSVWFYLDEVLETTSHVITRRNLENLSDAALHDL